MDMEASHLLPPVDYTRLKNWSNHTPIAQWLELNKFKSPTWLDLTGNCIHLYTYQQNMTPRCYQFFKKKKWYFTSFQTKIPEHWYHSLLPDIASFQYWQPQDCVLQWTPGHSWAWTKQQKMTSSSYSEW